MLDNLNKLCDDIYKLVKMLASFNFYWKGFTMIKLFIVYTSESGDCNKSIYKELQDYASAINFLENFVTYNNVLNVVITRG